MEFWSVSIGDVGVSSCDARVIIVFPPPAVVGPADWFGIHNMKIMTNRFDAADQFFAVSPSNAKRIGVPPLLRTASAALRLWECP